MRQTRKCITRTDFARRWRTHPTPLLIKTAERRLRTTAATSGRLPQPTLAAANVSRSLRGSTASGAFVTQISTVAGRLSTPMAPAVAAREEGLPLLLVSAVFIQTACAAAWVGMAVGTAEPFPPRRRSRLPFPPLPDQSPRLSRAARRRIRSFFRQRKALPFQEPPLLHRRRLHTLIRLQPPRCPPYRPLLPIR